jgi:hypothetical protein
MTLISTQDLTCLPRVAGLRDLLQSMAMLDAILCPEWEDRYYSFNAHWGDGALMGSMRNGQGDDFFALFNTYGCFFKGFVHDSPITAAGIDPAEHYRGMPPEFTSCATEPAFKADEVTFCIWQAFAHSQWTRSSVALPSGDDPDGSLYLLSPLDGNPETYRQWAESYYERAVPLHAVKAIYARQRLTDALVAALNSELRIKQLKDDIGEIGYPL